MWKKTIDIGYVRPILCQIKAGSQHKCMSSESDVQNVDIAPRYKRVPKVGWFRRRGVRLTYPTSNPPFMRKIGVDLNLQERLDELFAEEHSEVVTKAIDIGFPVGKLRDAPKQFENRQEYMDWKKNKRSDKELQRAARKNTLEVDMNDVKKEHEASGALFQEIQNAAGLYGVYEDLFDGAYFTPNVNLTIEFDYNEELVTPAFRGNVIKPKEATTEPYVHYECPENDSLWTLLLTNPDGHFTDNSSEYLHWMVTNIKGNDLSTGQVIAPYLQPFPAFGTGYHRYVFVLFKQAGEIDASKYVQSSEEIDLASRTFKTRQFFDDNEVTPAGLSFFQSDWDSTLTKFFHHTLNMREPRYEYDFPPYYTKPWVEKNPRHITPFNLFLDTKREPKEIQEEVLKKKLALTHPFKGQLDGHLEFPNAHSPQPRRPSDAKIHGSWRLREIERERLRQGYYKDMDWTALRRDPSNA